jgi:hypothetical protein
MRTCHGNSYHQRRQRLPRIPRQQLRVLRGLRMAATHAGGLQRFNLEQAIAYCLLEGEK